MRETWVPFFQDIRQSSMWAYDAETFKVWMTLLTMVDPEGYVCAAIPGIAIASGIPIDKVRKAMATFEAPDEDSRSQEYEGRRLKRVPRGWLMLNHLEHRKRAREEAEKARKRRWAAQHRANQTVYPHPAEGTCTGPECVGCVDPECDAVARSSGTLDASKSESKSESPYGGERGPEVMLHEIPDDWSPSPELRADATLACVTDLDDRIARLRTTRIGGRYGVRRSKLEDYVRSLFKDWKLYRETDSARRPGPAGAPAPPPAKARPHVPGFPKWVSPEHAELAKRRGRRLKEAVRGFAAEFHHPVDSLHPSLIDKPFREYLEREH